MTQAIIAAHGITTQFIENLSVFFKDVAAARKVRKAIRATEQQLMALSDRELNDIGICRGDIRSVARKDPMVIEFIDANPNLKGWV